MKHFRILTFYLLLLLGFAHGTHAAQLSIRLVEASREKAPPVAALSDVTEILSRNLPFASYSLKGRQTIALPANQTVVLGGYALTCTGPPEELKVVVQNRHRRTLVSTILRLQPGIPVMVGGFPSANGREIFILVAR